MPNVWPVVAEFFLALLAIVIVVGSRREVVDEQLIRELRSIDEAVRPLVGSTLKEAVIAYPESRIVFSDQFLGFRDCQWSLEPERIDAVQNVLNLFLPIAPYIAALAIEGHADTRRPSGCKGLAFGTNFELSQRRALSVFAGLLHVSIERLEANAEIDSANANLDGVVKRLRQRHRVLVAGYGATKPWPGVPDPENNAHRRVEIRLSLCRIRSAESCKAGG